MTKLSLLIAILLSGMLCLTGCGGSDSDDPGAVLGDPPVDATAAADLAFADTTPSGLAMTDKFSIVGRGNTYTVKCNAISGATSYTFTTSFGATEVSGSPTTSFLSTGPDNVFTLSVYATNGNGIQTKTASAEVNN